MSDLIGGRYQIDANEYNVIGVGGMGTVYLGLDTITHERVALKQLRPEISHDQPEMIARFTREAQSLARLNHPNIVKVFDTVEEPPYSYIVMEYISGGSLRDLIDRREQLPLKQILTLALDVSDALIRAHRLKILHRDIKPANVLIAKDGSPRLTDFGVARLEDEPGVTRTGTVIGTLNYLSPEALNGFELDERSDIWAFGVMLYEMLAGHLPFEANTMTGLITTILTKNPPPLANYRDDVPIGLELLVDKMLQKDRNDRMDSMRQVGAELERLMRDEPTSLETAHPAIVVTNNNDIQTLTTETYDRDTIAHESQRIPTEPVDINNFSPDRTDLNIAVTPAIRRSSPWTYVIGGLVGMIVLGMAMLVGGALNAPTIVNPTPSPSAPISVFAPYEYPVVIAQLEATAQQRTAVSRNLIADLRQAFEQDWLYSNIRIIISDVIVTNEAEATSLAQTHNAPLVIWGNYDDEKVDINLQLGSLERYPDFPFPRTTLERSINIRLTLIDTERESIAPYIPSALALIAAADGDVFEWARLMAVVDDLDAVLLPAHRDTLATRLYSYAFSYVANAEASLAYLNSAINQDSGFALLYWLRAMHFNRTYIQRIITSEGNRMTVQEIFNEARRDQTTAQRLAPSAWVAPRYSLFTINVGGTFRTIIELANTSEELASVIQQRPDLWAPLYLQSEIMASQNKNDEAIALIQQAIALNPNASLPYTSAILFYLRTGELIQVGELINQLVEHLPNTATTSRMFDILFGVAIPEGALPSVFGNLLIGQYQSALDLADQFLTGNTSEGLFGNRNNMLLFASIAQCNLQTFERARFGLNAIVASESDFMFARLVRANVNLRSANAERAETDFERILNSPQADNLAPFVAAVRQNTYRCTNFFDLDTITAITQEIARQDD